MHLAGFINQKSYEKVHYVLRRHPITFVPTVFLYIILMCMPVAVFFMVRTMFPELMDGPVLFPIMVLLGSAYHLGVTVFFHGQFIEFYLDEWVVTNDRVVDVEQRGLFARTISELDLFRIQDVTAEVNGIFATFFNYGDVHVQTASQNGDIIFRAIPEPNRIREDMLRLSHEDRKYHFMQPGHGGGMGNTLN